MTSSLLSSSFHFAQWSLGVSPHGSGLSYTLHTQRQVRMRKLVGVQRNKSSFLLFPWPLSLRQNRGLPRRWAWFVSRGTIWEEQQLALTFTQTEGNRDNTAGRHTYTVGVKCLKMAATWRGWKKQWHLENQRVDTHMENWFSLHSCKPFVFFSVSIPLQLPCSRFCLASDHVFPSWSHSQLSSCTQPIQRHKDKELRPPKCSHKHKDAKPSRWEEKQQVANRFRCQNWKTWSKFVTFQKWESWPIQISLILFLVAYWECESIYRNPCASTIVWYSEFCCVTIYWNCNNQKPI